MLIYIYSNSVCMFCQCFEDYKYVCHTENQYLLLILCTLVLKKTYIDDIYNSPWIHINNDTTH